MNVPLAAKPALREHERRAVAVEVDEQLARFLVVDHRADGDAEAQIRTGRAVLILVAAILAALGLVVPLVLVVEQRRQVRVGDDDDAASVAAVTARWATARHTILAAHGGGSVAAVASFDVDDGFVDEVHRA